MPVVEAQQRESVLIRKALGLDLKEDGLITRCFLCGHSAADGAVLTREHIIPRWILHQHQLLDQTLHLLNGQQFAYRKLTTPTCTDCNHALGQVEGRLQRGFRSRDIAWLRSPEGEDDLILLASKIYLGLRSKQLAMVDHRNARPVILDGEQVKTADPYINYMLQIVRYRTTISGAHARPTHLPATALAFLSASEEFQFMDDNLGDLLFRINGVTVLVSLLDCGHARERLEVNNPGLLDDTAGYPEHDAVHLLSEFEELILYHQLCYLSMKRVDDGLRIHSFDHVGKTLQMIVKTGASHAPLDQAEERVFIQERLAVHGHRLEFHEDASPSLL